MTVLVIQENDVGSQVNSKDSRTSPRVRISLRVNLTLTDSGQVYAVTRDISDGGIFLILDAESMPGIGEQVNVQVQGLPGGQEPPWVKMVVVRSDESGVGLKIIK